jgi:hypothetical protein
VLVFFSLASEESVPDFDLDPMICCIKGCSKPSVALGLCVNHWRRNKLYGSPVARKRHSGMFKGLPAEERFWLQVRKSDDCWIWIGAKDRDGYGIFKGDCNGVTYNKAHRFSYVLHNGEVGRLSVLHRCDNPPCVNPDHLFAGTTADNMRDKIQKGRARAARGEEAGPSKLTEDDVLAILNDPRPYASIAADHGVASSTIASLKNRRAWRHLSTPIAKGSHRGVHRRGASNLLTEQDVREIRSSSESGAHLAGRYGVSQQTICDIRKRRSWKHVD